MNNQIADQKGNKIKKNNTHLIININCVDDEADIIENIDDVKKNRQGTELNNQNELLE